MKRAYLLFVTLFCIPPALAGGAGAVTRAGQTAAFEIYLSLSQSSDPTWYLADVYLKNNGGRSLEGTVNGCPLTYTVTYRNKLIFEYEAGRTCNTALYSFTVAPKSQLMVRRGVRVARKANLPLASYLVNGNYSFKPSGQAYITLRFSTNVRK